MANKRTALAVLALLMAIVSSEAIPSSRVLGGEDVLAGQYPWAASVRVDGAPVCSGSIIHKQYILTAGHCVASAESSQVTARVGSVNKFAGGKIVQVAAVFVHPSYGNFLHDVAILKLDQNLTYTDRIDEIPMATENEIVNDNTRVSLAGWGEQENSLSPYKLQQVSMTVLNTTECNKQVLYGYDSVICLAHPEKTGICRGDGGAGVVSSNKLLAVASFSFGSCGTKYPDIASRLSYYRQWIASVME